MSARRVIVLLVAGLLVVAFAVWLSSRRHLERSTLAGDVVLQGLENALNTVTEVRLSKGDGTAATLKRGAEGWNVAQRDYPADSGKVRKLLLDLAALNVVEEKTRTPANYPLLGVEDVTSPQATGTRVDAVTPGKTWSVIVGKSSSGKSGYVRVVGAEQSLLATPLVSVDGDPRHWLDHTLLDIPQERIQEIAVKPAQGPAYTAHRDKKDQADFGVAEVPKGRELSSPAAADPIAGSLAGMTLDDVRRATDGAATPAPAPTTAPARAPTTATTRAPAPAAAPAAVVHATFRTFDGLELDVTGHKEGDKSLVTLTARSTAKETEAEAQSLAARLKGWEFELPSYKYDGMFRPLEDLLKKLPEPPAKPPKGGANPVKGTAKAKAELASPREQ